MSLLTEHFSREEFACHDGTPLPEALVPDTIRLCKNLEVLRAALGKPITILSGYRSPEHNGAVNGADHSLHLVGKAADIVVNGYKPKRWIRTSHGCSPRLKMATWTLSSHVTRQMQ